LANLRDIRRRISSVQSTQKITKAMQMVAAAKLRRAQEAAEAARPYAERMEAVLANLAAGAQGSDTAPKLLRGTGSDQTHLLIVATSERGLAGAFNSQICKEVSRILAVREADFSEVRLSFLGKKGSDFFRGRRPEQIELMHSVGANVTYG